MEDSYNSMYTNADYSFNTAMTDSTATAAAGFGIAYGLVILILSVIAIVSLWKLFTKAGKHGWAAIVPFYNQIVLLEVIGRPWWWLLLMMFVPFFGIWISVVVMLDLAKSFGKSVGYGILLLLVPFIGFPLLAFSKDAKYVGPVAQGHDGFGPAPDRAPVASVMQAPVPPVVPPTAPQQ